VYDVARYDGSQRTFKRARDAYDSFVGHIEGSIRAVWSKQVDGRAEQGRAGVLNGSTPAPAGATTQRGGNKR